MCMYAFHAAILFICSRSIIFTVNTEEDIQKTGDLSEAKTFTMILLANERLMFNIYIIPNRI